MTRLDEIGERRLIEGLFTERYGRSSQTFGDDCAYLLDTEGGGIVASTDPAPRPVAWQLGFEDYFHWGWLLAACNLSDLADSWMVSTSAAGGMGAQLSVGTSRKGRSSGAKLQLSVAQERGSLCREGALVQAMSCWLLASLEISGVRSWLLGTVWTSVPSCSML